ncbi:MAG: hypothetical protein WC757_03040 [Candidatus Paceibacterota bacterium]|jgi:hypothetical protein
MSLYLGRQAINGIAETVIIKGVQNNNQSASKFWLTHNEPRFMTKEKANLHENLLSRDLQKIKSKTDPKDIDFEKIFAAMGTLEKAHSYDLAEGAVRPLLEIFCEYDTDLVEIIFARYEEWKQDKQRHDETCERVPDFIKQKP